MNAVGMAIVWCAVQVTLVGVAAGILYFCVRKLLPAVGATVVLTALVVVVILSALAASPWPRWEWSRAQPVETARAASVAVAESAGSRSPGDPPFGPAPVASERMTDSPGWLFWQAVVDELSRPRAVEPRRRWRWPAVVAAVVLAGVAVGAVWLAVGLVAVRRCRRESQAIGDVHMLELADVLRAELSCVRAVQVRQSATLATAATIGWRRPLVLLPADWTTWTPAQRRAVLAHEIAHVCANDYLATLCAQLGVLLHFYHPLMHWLVYRLKLEQELAADAAAAAINGGPRQYLNTIAELALRQPDRSLVGPARSFLPCRSTFLRRIAMLRDAKTCPKPPARAVRAVAVGLVLACGLLVAGLRGPGAGGRALAQVNDDETEPAQVDGAIDLTYMPPEVQGFIALRPAAVFGRGQLQELGQVLAEVPGPLRDVGIPLAKLDQVLVLQVPAKPPWAWEESALPIIVLRATEPFEFEEFARHWVPRPVEREFQGRTYLAYGGPAATPIAAMYRPDDRTAIYASEHNVRVFMTREAGGVPEFLGEDTWQQVQDAHAIAALRSDDMKFVIKQTPEFAAFAPLWEQSEWAVLTARLNDQLRVQAVISASGEQGAQRIAETLEAGRVLARNLSNHFRAQAEPAAATPEALLAMFLDTADELIAHLRVETQQATVQAATSASTEALFDHALAEAVAVTREAAQRAQAMNNLKYIALAFHNFHDVYRHLPLPVSTKPLGGTNRDDIKPYSWRVAILPFVERSDLYQQYRFDEPWDSPANLQVLAQMPDVYRNPEAPADSTNTSYFLFDGGGALFDGDREVGFRDIHDGTSYTLMVVEAKRDVPWTKPEDIPYDPEKPLPDLGSYFEGGFHAAMADGSVRSFAQPMDEALLRALITRSGGEPTNVDRATGQLRLTP